MDNDRNTELNAWMKLQHLHNLAATYAICLVIYWFVFRRKRQNLLNQESDKLRDIIREVMSNRVVCREMIRMGPPAFSRLCNILREGGLKPSLRATIEEKVVKSLYILGHNVTTREIGKIFGKSTETINRHLHEVLDAVIELEEKYIKQPDGTEIPPEILNSQRFYPYFKDCIGAIDGAHIRVKVPPSDYPRFRGRKDFPTQNVLAACSFDLRFTYVLPGWEGTASDSRILKNALQRQDPLRIPQGKYYLVDAGFMLKSSFIEPYRGVRYHVKEYSRNQPKNLRELFNLRHASLRNAIERAFGVLKKRFPIIASATEPNYGLRTQKKIILACCILHNYLITFYPDVSDFRDVEDDSNNDSGSSANVENNDPNDEEDVRRGVLLRDMIAAGMWQNYSI